ncbi:GNAT family N-acetyltransferase [Halopenitus sp. POP-27]|uniref:GNAT family N-acetyltransferase n=1 Tax=Halopenitus sp. POP-27 TaxID=2994425 RepID=UPI0024696CB7|nr:GNAT family N-acetyltransferase [Halopenitus sp. POP-27]
MARRVRVATPEDAQAIRDIYAPFVEETPIAFRTDPPTTAGVAADIEETVETHPWVVVERIDGESTPESGTAAAPESGGGTVIGYASASQLRKTAAYQWTVEPSVYVADGHRGSGVGSGLYAALFRILRAQGFVSVYAVTTLPNPASVALHERFGFEPVGTFPAVGFKHGDWHDVRWWHRTLRDRPVDPDPPVPFADLVGTDALRALLNPDDPGEESPGDDNP